VKKAYAKRTGGTKRVDSLRTKPRFVKTGFGVKVEIAASRHIGSAFNGILKSAQGRAARHQTNEEQRLTPREGGSVVRVFLKTKSPLELWF